MHDIDSLFSYMRDTAAAGAVAVKETKERGVPVVGTYCTFTPWELIDAAGGIAVGLCSTSEKPIEAAERHLPRNLCPLIKSSYGYALTDTCPYFHFCDIVVGETTCDGKKKMYEYLGRLRPTHVMQLPQTASGDAALALWKSEVIKLKEVLETTFGVKITDEKIRESIKLKNRMNAAAMAFYDLAELPTPAVTGLEIMAAADFLKLSFEHENTIAVLEDAARKIKENYEAGERRVSADAKRILITGCPTGKSLEKVVTAIEENGGVVIGFENCGNIKSAAFGTDEDKDPIDALTERYLSIPCSVMSPNPGRVELLRDLASRYRADGVVDLVLQACHTYNVESMSIRESFQEQGVSYMSIETDYSQGDTAQLATRFGAFVEML